MNFEKALNLFFPVKCGICEKIGLPVCNKCEKLIEKYKINLVNTEIWNKKVEVEKIFIYSYKEIIRKLLINYKFNNCSYLAESFAYLIKNNEKIFGILKNYDIIIPVPLHKKRLLERGYNQTELIARKIGIKIETNCLIKIKNIKPQSTKNANERKADIKNIYILKNAEKIKGKKVLLIDDIYTTGSTANECIKTISYVVNKIGFLSIAKD